MRKLRCWISSEKTYARCPVINAIRKFLGRVKFAATTLKPKVPVLTEETIKVTGFVENREILVSVLGTVRV
jgi:hypothetical protein